MPTTGPVVTATLTRIAPPLHWEILNTPVSEDGGTTFSPQSASGDGEVCAVRCSKLDGHANVVLSTTLVFSPSHCVPPVTNIVGAGWTSTHNPTNASDHFPYVEEGVLSQPHGPLCPVYTNTVVHAGWTHNTAILWIRNLIRKLTGHLEDDNTDHCIGVLWEKDGSVDLWSFLDPSCLPYTNALSIRVWKNGGISGPPLGFLPMETRPSEMLPTIHNVVLCNAEGTEVYDRFWLVISSPTDRTEFDNWYAEYSGDLSWIDTIPIPPHYLDITTNVNGQITASIPVSFTDHVSWSSPDPFAPSDHMHHDAKYELRSETIDVHGNQATFDAIGQLITTTIAAGTADYCQPFDYWGNLRPNGAHRRADVLPYVRALQLDGNPGHPSSVAIPANITRPCLHQGETLDSYLICRPCVY